MAGHNKWSKVKHIKARVDAIKGRVFSKCARTHPSALAARVGGGDPAANSRLRTAIDNAMPVSMPKDNIDRAIKKGTGELGGDAIQEISYEGYGPAGIAFIIEMATDNLHRVAADTRLIFSKNGGITEQEIFEAAIEAGSQNVLSDADDHLVIVTPNELGTAANALRHKGFKPVSEKLVSIPQTLSIVCDLTIARRIIKLHELLDDYPDTLNVFTNFEVADEILDRLAS